MESFAQFTREANIVGECVTLRAAHPDDIPLIETYIRGMDPEERRLRYLYNAPINVLINKKRLTRVYDETLDYTKHMAFVVATKEGRIIGVSHASGPCDGEDGRYECSYSRHVDYRGKGVGTLLMRGLLDWGDAAHILGLWADTLRENTRMRNLFEAFGFTKVFPHPEEDYTLIRYRYDFPQKGRNSP